MTAHEDFAALRTAFDEGVNAERVRCNEDMLVPLVELTPAPRGDDYENSRAVSADLPLHFKVRAASELGEMLGKLARRLAREHAGIAGTPAQLLPGQYVRHGDWTPAFSVRIDGDILHLEGRLFGVGVQPIGGSS